MEELYDVIVVGGGAAGMFAAIHVGLAGKRVLVLERNDRLGKKLRITGKGRCNVTNCCAVEEVLQNVPRNGRFLYSAVTQYPPARVMEFLEAEGCPLKTERNSRRVYRQWYLQGESPALARWDTSGHRPM